MKDISEELVALVYESLQKFEKIDNYSWELKSVPNKWTKKEVLGHLIDSAANNHQRFVRTQFEETPIIAYNQNKWAEAQIYNNADINNMIKLWENYNKHLAYIISMIPNENLDLKCDIRKDEPVSLEWLVTDYLRHTKHHLNKIIDFSSE